MSWGEMLMVLEIVSLTGFVTCFYGALSKQQKKMSKEATTPLCLVNNWNHISVYLHLHTFTDLFGAPALRKHSIKINWRFLALAGKAAVVAVVNCDNACLYHSYRSLQDISPAGKQDYSWCQIRSQNNIQGTHLCRLKSIVSNQITSWTEFISVAGLSLPAFFNSSLLTPRSHTFVTLWEIKNDLWKFAKFPFCSCCCYYIATEQAMVLLLILLSRSLLALPALFE